MKRALIAIGLAASACGGPRAKGAATPAPAPGPPPASAPAPRARPIVLPAIVVTGEPAKPSTIVVVARARVEGALPAGAAADAIAKLQAFVAAHPDHPQYTPDAMLRLGALELDAADDALDAGDEAAFARATGDAVRALGELVARFPAYPRVDDAWYLLGYARAQAGDDAGAIAAYETVAAIAVSPRALEARFRAGEACFDGGQLDRAIAAYAAVAGAGDPKLATIARYKLAWAHYRKDEYAAAIADFQAIVDLADSGTDATAAELRSEAAQYVAIALVEPDWDGDGADDPPPAGARSTATVARIAAALDDGALAARREVAELAARTLADEARDREAAAAYRLVRAVTSDDAARARIDAALAALAARRPP